MNIILMTRVLLVLSLAITPAVFAAGQGTTTDDTHPASPGDTSSPTDSGKVPLQRSTPPESGQSHPGSIEGAIDLPGSRSTPSVPGNPRGTNALPGNNDGSLQVPNRTAP